MMEQDEKIFQFSKGSPETVLEHCAVTQEEKKDILADVDAWALKGYRTIALAYKEFVDEEGYTKLLTQKRRELHKVQEKIEELELAYLSHELERINTLAILEPKRRYIDTLKENVKELELEKEHFASTKLHQLPQMGLAGNKVTNENSEEIVETSILEKES